MRTTQRSTRPARKPSQRRAVETVEVILEAAARILERDGMGRSFGTNRIAREAGVSIGSLYEYFEGKDAILRALMDRHAVHVRQLVDERFAELREAPVSEAIPAFVDAIFELHELRPRLQATLHRELAAGHAALTDQYVDEKVVEWLSARRPELTSEDVTTRTFVAVRATRSVTMHAFLEGLPPDRRVAVREATKRLLLEALAR
jgi:AcrR family transcriptional regulator